MRRWLGRLAAGILFTASVSGCHHTAGVCDCAPNGPHACCYGLGGYHGAMGVQPMPGAYGQAIDVQSGPAPKITPAPKMKGAD